MVVDATLKNAIHPEPQRTPTKIGETPRGQITWLQKRIQGEMYTFIKTEKPRV